MSSFNSNFDSLLTINVDNFPFLLNDQNGVFEYSDSPIPRKAYTEVTPNFYYHKPLPTKNTQLEETKDSLFNNFGSTFQKSIDSESEKAITAPITQDAFDFTFYFFPSTKSGSVNLKNVGCGALRSISEYYFNHSNRQKGVESSNEEQRKVLNCITDFLENDKTLTLAIKKNKPHDQITQMYSSVFRHFSSTGDIALQEMKITHALISLIKNKNGFNQNQTILRLFIRFCSFNLFLKQIILEAMHFTKNQVKKNSKIKTKNKAYSLEGIDSILAQISFLKHPSY